MLTPVQADDIACGNKQAAAFLMAFHDRAHFVDDIEDHELPAGRSVAQMEADWLMTLAGNEFFLDHRGQLVPLMLLALNAWEDSNRWRTHTDKEKQVASDVIKGFYHEVFFLVAFLTGGWDHLKDISSRYRGYSFAKED